jgi:hypothetical protein
MRITVVAAVWADGRNAYPLVIHKGKENNGIARDNGVLHTTQPKAWVNQSLFGTHAEFILAVRLKCIVWDSCRVHIGSQIEEHCFRHDITLVVIPGGMTPYLQAGDIGIYKEFKDKLSPIIDECKRSDHVEYTRANIPK